MIAATRWTAAARLLVALLVPGALGLIVPAAAGAQEHDPEAAAPATTVATTITAHNRADAPVELWAGRVFLGRVEPGGAIVRSAAIERRAGDGALAIIGIDRSEADQDPPAEGNEAAGVVYRAGVIVLPGDFAASEELFVVWGGIDPPKGGTPRVLDDPGEHAHRVLHRELWQAAEGHTAGAPLPSAAGRIGTTLGGARVMGGVLAVHRTPRDEADAQDGRDSYATNPVGMLFVRIPAGSFQPGTFQRGSARPTVTLTRDYYMSVTETTNAHMALALDGRAIGGAAADLPALKLTWDRAMEWCTAMDAMGEAAGMDGWTHTLPTEAQWERACQAGKLQPFSPAGQPEHRVMWWTRTSGERPQPVAQLLPNDFGLFDMHGNAMEWGRDWASMREPMSGVDPAGVGEDLATRTWGSNEPERVRRGGAFNTNSGHCTCGLRDSGIPGLAMPFQGFRPVLERE
ncbi:MAG: formylglycine-generating enzyme family protein [Phycisphaerales bacterium JB060]